MENEDPTQTGGAEEEKLYIDAGRLAIEQAIAKRVHEQNAPELHSFDEETGQISPTPLGAAPPAPVEAPSIEDAPAPVAEPAPAAPKMVPIVVHGQTIEVEESRLLEAGKRTLQKESAADKKLQEAVAKERQADELLRRLRAQIPQPSQDAASQPAPSSDAPKESQATFDPETLDKVLETKLYALEATKAAAKFKADFPEIAADPSLMEWAAALENQRLRVVTALGESPGDPHEAYRKHGEEIRRRLKAATPAPALEEKAERKRTVQAVPAASAKAPVSSEKKPPTVQELIEQERQRRLGKPINGGAQGFRTLYRA